MGSRVGRRGRRRPAGLAVGLVVALAAVAAAVVGAGQWAEARVQSVVAARIEQQLPGSTATVHISSFPFLARLAASGTVSRLTADIHHVRATPSPLTFDRVRVEVRDLRVRRDRLLHRQVTVDGVGSVTVDATVTQSSLDDSLGLPITLGDGMVEVAGVRVPLRVAVVGRQVSLSGPLGTSASFPLPSADVLPCVPALQVVPGSLHLGCTGHRVPAFVTAETITF